MGQTKTEREILKSLLAEVNQLVALAADVLSVKLLRVSQSVSLLVVLLLSSG